MMPLLAFCCHYYGWNLNECLELPLKTLFAFHREGKKLQAAEHFEALRIQAVSIMNLDYYKWMRELYLGIADPKTLELPPKPVKPAHDLSSTETKNKLIQMFSHGKRGLGYGR